jgi:phosphotriesterase-related protein
MAEVQTVTGPVDSGSLGVTLVHEHLRSTSETVREQFPHLYDERRERERAVQQVRNAMENGVRTIVDPACMDLGRSVELARHVVEETGVQLVLCTGIYGSHYTFLPQHFQNRDVDYLADAFVHDIEQGIQGTEVKAAFLKCAVDEPGITDDVDKVLRACARACTSTGRPIMAHSHPATRRGLEIMDVLEDEGVEPAKVQIAHTGDTDDLDYIGKLLGRGPFIGMDRYGLDIILPNDKRNATVIELCRRGHAERMMLSQDACAFIDWFPEEEIAQLAPNWHFTYLWDGVLPALREGGVSEEQIETMLVANPARWLAGDAGPRS